MSSINAVIKGDFILLKCLESNTQLALNINAVDTIQSIERGAPEKLDPSSPFKAKKTDLVITVAPNKLHFVSWGGDVEGFLDTLHGAISHEETPHEEAICSKSDEVEVPEVSFSDDELLAMSDEEAENLPPGQKGKRTRLKNKAAQEQNS